MQKIINICFCGNNGYIPYIGVALRSILANLDPDYTLNVFLICDFADRKNRKKLHKTLQGHNLHILPIDRKKLEGIKVCGYPGIETYFRLFIHDYVEVDKILYLDGDIIINTDIAPLFELDLWKYTIGMSRYFYAYFDEKKKKPVVKNYGPTGNAGVLLINLKQRKEHNITQKALDYMKAHYETLSLGDEEALNNVFGEDFLLLDNKWDWATVFYNIHYSYQEGIAYLDDKEDHEDVVMHYIGKQKPWGRFSTNPKTLFYYKYLFKSPRWKPIDVIKYLYYSFVFFIIKNKYIYNFAHKIFTRVKKKILKS